MKMIFLSDVHLVVNNPVGRLDDLTVTQWEKLEYVFRYAKRKKIDTILQAGDLTDIKRSWELLQKLSRFLKRWRKENVNLYCVRGQHDSYYHDMSNNKTILGVLFSSGLVTELTNKPVLLDDHQIYGASYGVEVPKVDSSKGKKILVIHKQILMNKLWCAQEDFVFAEKFIKEHRDYDVILCGDAHQSFVVYCGRRIICNTGVLLRLESSEQMMEHEPKFYVYDAEENSIETVLIPCEKSKTVLSREHLIHEKERKENFDLFIKRVQDVGDGEKSVSFDANLDLIMKKNKTKESVKKLVAKYLEFDDKK